MNFSFSAEEQRFQQRVRDFFLKERVIAEKAKEEWDSGMGLGPYCWKILGMMGERGWICPTWPKRYGGLELSYVYKYIIMEVLHHFTDIYTLVGAGMAGPVILKRGTEEQKEKYLPQIARGEVEYALGYTEPEAGSDLASLSMKAEDKGDHFLINGSKLFNTRIHYSRYHWLGARTAVLDKKFKGISLFIVDWKDTPGITIRPIWTVGGRRTNEVFYDNVKLPRECLVGEIHKGFYYILEALDYERISTVGGLQRDLQEITGYVKATGKYKDPLVRQKLAQLAIDIESAKLLAFRVAWMLDQGKIPNYEAGMLKMLVAETEQTLINTAMQILGPYGQVKKGSKWAQMDGKYEWLYRDTLETLITRGTSEIMRNIIAQRGLGLPKDQ
jgi:alkylation response protein AidB-like acyl-CoA dehydrogenase